MVRIAAYDEFNDTFTVTGEGFAPTQIPGLLLPALIGECGEPDELIGREFVINEPQPCAYRVVLQDEQNGEKHYDIVDPTGGTVGSVLTYTTDDGPRVEICPDVPMSIAVQSAIIAQLG